MLMLGTHKKDTVLYVFNRPFNMMKIIGKTDEKKWDAIYRIYLKKMVKQIPVLPVASYCSCLHG